MQRRNWKTAAVIYQVKRIHSGIPLRCMDIMGRAVVREALRQCGGNRSQAARLLGLSRPTLLARMEKYGLKIETRISDE